MGVVVFVFPSQDVSVRDVEVETDEKDGSNDEGNEGQEEELGE